MPHKDNQYETLLEALYHLKKEGYSDSFHIKDDGLYCDKTEKTYTPDQIDVVESHRFEGDTNIDDMSIVYAIETSGGSKGVVVDAFGMHADARISEFFDKAHYKEGQLGGD